MSPEQALGKILREGHLTLAVAESITGGLVGDKITDVPGASDYFLGAITSYSNKAKEDLLGVSSDTLRTHGAVSGECALEMAEGVRQRFRSDIGLSVTGIAGPSGATAEKPVGLVFFAYNDGQMMLSESLVIPGDRAAIKHAAAEHLIAMALELLSSERS
ncbi:MAG: competence damage-inducible protein A [Methanomassiliicoccales archaeon PtaU1.Bin124]|nr:MAG: competence damage-inducible protein A [Methanomassiliicoccales archaeon PtaU1.Bin124]